MTIQITDNGAMRTLRTPLLQPYELLASSGGVVRLDFSGSAQKPTRMAMPPLFTDLAVPFGDGNTNIDVTDWTQNYIAFFDATNLLVRYFIFDKKPTVLTVEALDGIILWIEFTSPSGTRIYGGQMYRADMSTDTDGDGVPDFLEEP